MTCEDGFKSLPCAEGFHLGLHLAPAKVSSNFIQRKLFQMQQREQGAVIRRQMGEDKLHASEIIAR